MKRLNVKQWFLVISAVLFAGQGLAAEKAAVLDWYQRLLLSTPVSGVVGQVYVKAGQHVKQKQKLVKLDDRGFRAQVSKAEAVLSRATENHAEAKREMDRAEELFDRTAISVHERQIVKIDYTRAIADLKEAQADLVRAQLDLEYSEIRAPFDGIVTQVLAQQGQTVVNRWQATPLIALVSSGKMLARSMLGANEIDGLGMHDQVKVRVSGETMMAKVHHLGIEPANTEQPPLYILEVEFDTGEKRFLKGQGATIILP